MICECGCGKSFRSSYPHQRFASNSCRLRAERRRKAGEPGSEKREEQRRKWREEKAREKERSKNPEGIAEVAAVCAEIEREASKAPAIIRSARPELCGLCPWQVREGKVNPCKHPGLWTEKYGGKSSWQVRTQGHCPWGRPA